MLLDMCTAAKNLFRCRWFSLLWKKDVFFCFFWNFKTSNPQKCWGKIYKEFLKPEFFEHFGRGIRGFRYFSPWVTPRKKITRKLKITQFKSGKPSSRSSFSEFHVNLSGSRSSFFLGGGDSVTFHHHGLQFPPLIARCHRSAWCAGSPWCRWASLRCLESDGNAR